MTTMTTTAAPTSTDRHRLARYASPTLLAIGIVAIASGFGLLAVHDAGLVQILVGTYLICSGVGQLPVPFGSHIGSSRVLALLAADVYVILGTLCFNKQLSTPPLIALWIGLAMIFRGLTWQNATLMNKDMPARGLQGLAGLAVLLSGDLIVGSRPDSPAAVALLTGCVLIVTGALEVITAFRVRRT